MHPHSFLWHYLWIAPHVLQVLIVAVMIRRRMTRDFPMFFAYTVFEIVYEGTMFILDHSPSVSPDRYWQAHWVGLGISIILRFGVVYEIFSHVFRKYPGLWALNRSLLSWTTVVLLLAAVAVSAQPLGDDTYRILSAVNVVNRAVSLIQIGLLMFIFVFSSACGLSWRSHVYGIALGLGVFSSVDLAIAAMRVWVGTAAGNYVFSFVTMAAYHCCVLIWLVYLLVPEPSGRRLKDLPANNLEQWSAELHRLLLR